MPKIKAKVSGKGNAHLTASLLSKSRLCEFYAKGKCNRGDACTFAHGDGEVIARPDFSRTQVCRSFVTTGSCAKGDACQFAHAAGNLKNWCHWMSDARDPELNARWAAHWSPGALRGAAASGKPRSSPSSRSTQSTQSNSQFTQSTQSEEEAGLIDPTVDAVHAWQEHRTVQGNAGTIAGPPGLTTGALDDAHQCYRDHRAVQERRGMEHRAVQGNAGTIAGPPGLTSGALDHDHQCYRDHRAVQGEGCLHDRHNHWFAQEKVEPPAQPPMPPQRWLGNLAHLYLVEQAAIASGPAGRRLPCAP